MISTAFPYTSSQLILGLILCGGMRCLHLAELTVCFEANFEEIAQRKSAKFMDLVEQATYNNYSVTLHADYTNRLWRRTHFQRLATVTRMSKQMLSHLFNNAMIAALTGSFQYGAPETVRQHKYH